MTTNTREEIQAEIADLRRRARAIREMAAYADSREARLDDERSADRLEAAARELEQQLTEGAS